MLKSELYKAFHNKGIYIACIVGMVLAALAFFMDAQIEMMLSIQQQDAMGVIYRSKTDTGINIYSQWMGMRMSNYEYILFFLMPLMCVMPHGISYCRDIKSGYVNQILTRVSCKKYYGSKLLAVMISGGFVCVSPLIINFVLCMCVFPFSAVVKGTGYFNIFYTNVFSNLFFQHAWLYVCVYLIFVFLYMGMIAAITLGMSCFDQNMFVVMSAPFIIVFAMHTVCTWLLGNEAMSVLRITSMNTILTADLWKIGIEMIILILFIAPYITKLIKKKGDIL